MPEYEYFLTLLVTAAVTYLLTPAVRKLATRMDAFTPTRDRDVHATPIPRMGGLAMYFGLAAGLIVATDLTSFHQEIGGSGLVNGLLLAGGLIVIIGIVDDKWGLNAIGKLAGQIAAAGILVKCGALLSTIPLPDNHQFAPTYNESVVVTIVLIVATINAVNFIDGLDGLAAGIVGIAAISFFLYYYSLTKVGSLAEAIPVEAVPTLAAVILAGVCLGFLPHNFHPARIFMGDTGSMLLGLLLAYVPISAIPTLDLQSLTRQANRFAEILPFLLPAAVMVVPYTDLLRAVIRRTRAGQSPLAADRQHLHHRMLDIGHSHRSSVLILYAWAAVFSGAVVGLSILATPLLILAGFTLVAVLVLVLLSIPRLRWWQRDKTAVADRRPPARGQSVTSAPAVAAPAASAPDAGTAAVGKEQANASAVPRPVALPAPVPLGPPASYASRHGAPEPPTAPDIYQFRGPVPSTPAAPAPDHQPDETRPDLLGTRPWSGNPQHGETNLPSEPERDRSPEQRLGELGSGTLPMTVTRASGSIIP